MTFISGDRIQDVQLEHHNVQYLYTDGDFYFFMDQETYEQPAIRKELVKDVALYLLEGMEAKLTYYEQEPLDLEIPLAVEHVIANVEKAVRGDTATGVSAKAVTETGLQVQVPGFVNVGDKIRIDTRTGTYVTRVEGMRTPAGKECPYFYGDYFRGKKQEECRLLPGTHPDNRWNPALCNDCPVPGIVFANACEHMALKAQVVRTMLGLRSRVSITADCSRCECMVEDPHVGCGQCHPNVPTFTVGE